MGLRSFGFICCLVLLLVLPLGAADAAQQRPFFFFVITDVQFGMFDQDRDLTRESENLEKLVAAANRLRPAFIVDCGDMVNKAGNAEEVQRYESIMAKLDPQIKVYHVAGNHDVGNRPTVQSLEAYRRLFGPDYYSFQYPGFQGIVINTSLIKNPDSVGDEAKKQSEWLKTKLSEMKKNRADEVVVFQHMPWFLHDPNENDNYSNLQRPKRREYLRQFKKAKIHYIFAGHLHDSAVSHAEGIEMRTVSALGKPLGRTESGFGVVVIEGHDLKFTFYPIDALPAEIH